MALKFYRNVPEENAKVGKDKNGVVVPDGSIIFTVDAKHIYMKNGDSVDLYGDNDPKLIESLQEADSNLDKKIDNAVDTLNQKIDNGIANLGVVYNYKGSVDTMDALPTEGVRSGDVYNVVATGMNYGAIVGKTYTFGGDGDSVVGNEFAATDKNVVLAYVSAAATIKSSGLSLGSKSINVEGSAKTLDVYCVANVSKVENINKAHLVAIDENNDIILVSALSNATGTYWTAEDEHAEELLNDYTFSVKSTTENITWDSLGATINLEWN